MSQQRPLFRYVLGDVSEAEQQEIEAQLFANADFLHEAQAVCDEVIDVYLAGELPVRDCLRFEERLRSLPFLSDYVETNRALFQIANQAKPVVTTAPLLPQKPEAALSWWGRLNFFTPPWAIATVGVGVFLSLIWFVSKPRPVNQPSDHPVAQATSRSTTPVASSSPVLPLPTMSPSVAPPAIAVKPFSAPSPLPVIASILLSVDVVRSESQVAQLRVPSARGTILLQLEIPAERKSFDRARLQTTLGEEVRTWQKIVLTRHQDTSIVELKVLAQELKTGDYFITLSRGATPAYQFRFHVEAQ